MLSRPKKEGLQWDLQESETHFTVLSYWAFRMAIIAIILPWLMHKFEPGVEFSRKKGREEGTMWTSKIWDNNFMIGCMKVKKKKNQNNLL